MTDKIRHFFEFDGFRLDIANHSLWRNDELVAIPPKALETLILLIENDGEIVSREQLLETVWKDTFVEEGNINYTISLLRKTLSNKNLIQTVPRRGYRFAGDIKEIVPNERVALTESEIPASEPTSGRWILVSIFLVGVLFLTSFAYWWRTRPAPPVEDNPPSEALRAYTRGKMILSNRTVAHREEKAIDEFQKAITLDPTLALAYCGLAESFSSIATKTNFPESADYFAKAKTAGDRSLEIDPNLAEGYLIRGWLKRQADWDWSGAETDLRQSIRLNSRNPLAHLRLAQLLSAIGRQDEALAEIKIAYEIDPIGDYVVGGRFPILEARGEYETALRESEQFLRENKSNANAVRAYATFQYHTGNYPKVIELGEQALVSNPNFNNFAWFSLLHAAAHKSGQTEQAEEYLKRLEALAAKDTRALYSLAMNYAELNRIDEALAALENCLKMREERMIWLKVEPRFANLKANPRFQNLVKAMRLE